jgi:hypothetical protein
MPADRCEIHHVTGWADTGPTDIDNLTLVCPRHHLDVTDGTWQLQMINGVPWARPPPGPTTPPPPAQRQPPMTPAGRVAESGGERAGAT